MTCQIIFFTLETTETTQKPVIKSTYKRSYCKKIFTNLKILWTTEIGITLKKIKDTNKAYKYFLDIFIDFYDNSFPKTEVKVKFKGDQNTAIRALGLLKALRDYQKRKRLYEKFLKNRTPKNEETYKTDKNLYETI